MFVIFSYLQKSLNCDPKTIRKISHRMVPQRIVPFGEIRSELSISPHFYWKNLRKTVHKVCTKYKACQFLKGNMK